MIDSGRLRKDALEVYVAAQARLELVQKAWEAAGRPFVLEHANKVVGRHPLFGALMDAEQHAERLRRPLLRRGHAGPRSFLDVAAEENRIGDDLSPAATLRLIPRPVATPVRRQTRDGAA